MLLLTACLRDLKFPEKPSLKKFLDFRLCAGDLEDKKTEHRRYKAELDIIGRYYDDNSDIGDRKLIKWKKSFKESFIFDSTA
ncbi:8288_t:CDS:2 [Paraglomus occultum]|uniref:8288_t:CDS:1 n=1 Tax=Paraglomus occultum TaxID=144539 RepID=A0A9N8ZDZ0_9GLOM|nr:8288_t:CDS:2 [Paraglomus occultum]